MKLLHPLSSIPLFACLLSSSALAQKQFEIPFAYVDAAVIQGVPPEVLYAVALQESWDYKHVFVSRSVGKRPWPWTLNVKGKPLIFKSKADACVVLKTSLQKTKIVDVGLAQLNVHYQPQLFGIGGVFENPCDALNPYMNLDAAAELLRARYEVHGNWIIASGRYHRPAGGKPASKYSLSVSKKLQQLGFHNYEFASR
jgi:soluble lytic murein transglycosylase-like protein